MSELLIISSIFCFIFSNSFLCVEDNGRISPVLLHKLSGEGGIFKSNPKIRLIFGPQCVILYVRVRRRFMKTWDSNNFPEQIK